MNVCMYVCKHFLFLESNSALMRAIQEIRDILRKLSTEGRSEYIICFRFKLFCVCILLHTAN